MKIIRSLAVAGLLSSVAAPAMAAPIVYTGSQATPGFTGSYTVTTDGTLGTLAASNILSFTATVNNPTSTFSYGSDTGGVVQFAGGDLSATSTSLIFALNSDFGANNRFNFVFEQIGTVGSAAIRFENFIGNRFITLNLGATGSLATRTNSVIGTVTPMMSGVPEPATWAMMIAGFCMVGFAMRRRQKVSTTVRFA